MLFYKNASFSLCISQKWPLWIKITSAQKYFLWHHFLRCHGPPGPHDPAWKMGIYSIFSNIIEWPLNGKIISSTFRKNIRNRVWKCTRKATEVNKSPEVYNTCMIGNSQFCIVFPVAKCLCIFWGSGFFQIIYIGFVLEILYSSSIKCTHKQKDTENSTFHIKLLKHHG